MNKIVDTKTFDITDDIKLECEMKRTLSGTREFATVIKNGVALGSASYFWSNRPWQSFTYCEAIRRALRNTPEFTPEQRKAIEEGLLAKDLKRVNGMFKTVAAVAQIGEVLCEKQEEKNNWKLRMMKAGMPRISVPDDWELLSEDEKELRLNRVLELAKQ